MNATARPPRRAFVEHIMSMPISVHVRGPLVDSAVVADRVAAVFAELRAVEAEFSVFRPDSAISRLNRGEVRLAECGPLVREVAELCRQARTATDGYFEAFVPEPSSSAAPGQASRGAAVHFNPTGLVKGWAVQRAASHLADLDGHDFCLNAGGDVLLTTVDGNPPWRVGIESPAQPSAIIATLTLHTGAVATSGTAHRGTHIVDPFTGARPSGPRSVSVVGPTLLWADVYATAAFVRGCLPATWPANEHGYEALFVDALGGLVATLGWPELPSSIPV